MLDVVNYVVDPLPCLDAALYIDDRSLGFAGTRDEVSSVIAIANRRAHAAVQDVGMELSPLKSIFISADRKTVRRVCRASRNGGVCLKTVKMAKMLGCGMSGGRRRCIRPLAKRLAEAKAKVGRVQKLRRAGVCTATWQRVAGNPAMLYGVHITGVSNSM